MSRFVHILAQLANMIAAANDKQLFDPQWDAWLNFAHLAIGGILGLIAHHYNTDGTSQRVADTPAAPPRPPLAPLLALLLLPGALDAQTRATPEQIKAPVTADACRVFAVLPTGGLAIAVCDGLELVAASGTGGMALRARPQPTAAVTERMPALRVTGAPQTTWALPDTPAAGSLMVFRNGLLLSEGDDYSFAGQTVTFLPGNATPLPGDILRARYRL